MGDVQDARDKVSNTWILKETEPEIEMVVLLRNETMGSVYQEKFEYPAKMKANKERNYH